jgi:hypothetical protein
VLLRALVPILVLLASTPNVAGAVVLAAPKPAEPAGAGDGARKPKCTNFDTRENCARREANEQRAREKAAQQSAKASVAGDADAVTRNADGSVELAPVVVEQAPEDFVRPELSAQQKLEKAWGEAPIPNGPISYRGNNGVRVECEGAVLRNRQRMGLLAYLIPLPPCVSSGDPRPGYLKPR